MHEQEEKNAQAAAAKRVAAKDKKRLSLHGNNGNSSMFRSVPR